MSRPIFYVGQAVGCLCFGQGVVSDILSDTFKVEVTFDNRTVYFTEEGKYTMNSRPTLYPIDQYREIIANIPAPQPEAWKPKPGEWCWFWDDGDIDVAILNKFSGYDPDNKSYPYLTITKTVYANCAQFVGKLPEHLKEVQP